MYECEHKSLGCAWFAFDFVAVLEYNDFMHKTFSTFTYIVSSVII